MTRLTSHHIANIPAAWESYTQSFKERTGFSLFEIACRTLNLDVKKAQSQCQGQNVAVIPLNTGEGKIEGFDTALASIAIYLGFNATVLPADNAGFAQYQAENFDIAIWADDDNFIAENKHTALQAENGVATGSGFAEVLSALVKNHNQTILVRGCGPVGQQAASYLSGYGYKLLLCDVVYDKAKKITDELTRKGRHALAITPSQICEHTTHIGALFDAAPVPAQNDELPTTFETIVVAPCVPYLWEDQANRWHDPLQLGTAVMLIAAATNTPCNLAQPPFSSKGV